MLMLSGVLCKSKDNKKGCYLGRSVSPKFVSSSKV
nr:MAG TPA: Putative transferase CAF17, mitochondrial [Caudoviricetes sp.]